MTCPECGGKTRVPESRTDGKKVYRRRRCVLCGYSFYTEESETFDKSGMCAVWKKNNLQKFTHTH